MKTKTFRNSKILRNVSDNIIVLINLIEIKRNMRKLKEMNRQETFLTKRCYGEKQKKFVENKMTKI